MAEPPIRNLSGVGLRHQRPSFENATKLYSTTSMEDASMRRCLRSTNSDVSVAASKDDFSLGRVDRGRGFMRESDLE